MTVRSWLLLHWKPLTDQLAVSAQAHARRTSGDCGVCRLAFRVKETSEIWAATTPLSHTPWNAAFAQPCKFGNLRVISFLKASTVSGWTSPESSKTAVPG